MKAKYLSFIITMFACIVGIFFTLMQCGVIMSPWDQITRAEAAVIVKQRDEQYEVLRSDINDIRDMIVDAGLKIAKQGEDIKWQNDKIYSIQTQLLLELKR